MKQTDTDHDDIAYLLKIIEWPAEDKFLSLRIRDTITSGSAAYDFPFRSPLLSMMAIILALFIGVASGSLSSNPATATEIQTNGLYETSGISLTSLYIHQANQGW